MIILSPSIRTMNTDSHYMDTDSLFIHIKTEDFYGDTADDAEKVFDTSNYEVL